MIIEQIFFFFLLISFLAIAVLFCKKIPQLCSIDASIYEKRENFFKKKLLDLKNSSLVSEFSWVNIYQRILSRTRVLILRFEKRIADHLYNIRKSNSKDN
ncbi:MAG: hypothetical protein PHV25_02820 [Candidatus Pacebacteria bacterium]|nr:hypothetical protein [Candidatus Paceibacterota bacterium]